MFSNMDLSARLKAAVNGLEQAGNNFQARSLNQAQVQQAPAGPAVQKAPISATAGASAGASDPRPASPTPTPKVMAAKASNGSTTSLGSPTSTARPGSPSAATSPRSAGLVYPNHLAESAIAGLSGLRKSFNFPGRPSAEFTRPSATASNSHNGSGVNEGARELQDVLPTTSNPGSSSRSASPSRMLNTATFALGSGSTTVNATPQLPRSPKPSRSPLAHVPPDPSDPSTYPLPPSPDLKPDRGGGLHARSGSFADPLGASPLILAEEADTPGLVLADLEAFSPVANGTKSVLEPKSDAEDVATASLEVDGLPSVVEADSVEVEKTSDNIRQELEALRQKKQNADRVLKELTPLEGGTDDHEALEGWVRMATGKVEMVTAEMQRLQNQISLQSSRMEELRDTHRLEGSSQSELITKLRSQLSKAESNLAAKAADLLAMDQMKTDLNKAQSQVKEEEEKRNKAIQLLKTVRAKLVKAEKEKEEIEKDRAEERAQRSQAGEEAERIKAERAREVDALRKGFERELASTKERYEKDLQAKKAAWELEMITTKATHAKEMSNRTTKVSGLESIVKELSDTKQRQFNDIQTRQAELESARSEAEALQTRTRDLEFQLRESIERVAMLEELSGKAGSKDATSIGLGLPGARSHSPSGSRSNSYNGQPGADMQRLLAEAESRSEAKLSDLRSKMRNFEKERNEAEEEWAAKLQDRVRELELLRRQIQEREGDFADHLRNRGDVEKRVEELEEGKRALERELRSLQAALEDSRGDVLQAADAERNAREELDGIQSQISALEGQLEEAKTHSTALKANNKTLRDELRKVQSSVQLMEKQRNPGVGYWAQPTPAGPSRSMSSLMSPIGGPSEPSTPGMRPSIESTRESLSGAPTSSVQSADGKAGPQDEEEVNLEYLRNVILQFLEHKEMRPNLVRVLSVILRFTPQELRRLNAKLLT